MCVFNWCCLTSLKGNLSATQRIKHLPRHVSKETVNFQPHKQQETYNRGETKADIILVLVLIQWLEPRLLDPCAAASHSCRPVGSVLACWAHDARLPGYVWSARTQVSGHQVLGTRSLRLGVSFSLHLSYCLSASFSLSPLFVCLSLFLLQSFYLFLSPSFTSKNIRESERNNSGIHKTYVCVSIYLYIYCFVL